MTFPCFKWLSVVYAMDFIAVHPLMIGFLFPKSGKIEAGRKEKDEDDRNKQCCFGFFHHVLRLERKGSDCHKSQIHPVPVWQYMHFSFEEEIITHIEDASECDVNQAFGLEFLFLCPF